MKGSNEAWNVDLDDDGVLDDPWDFGTESQYPALAVDLDGDGWATWQEFGYQLRAGPTLTAVTGVGQGVALAWTAADTSPWSPAPEVAYTVIRGDGAAADVIATDLAGLQYTDTAVTAGAAYTYQVAAVVDRGEAARSALVEIVAGVADQPLVAVGRLPDRTLKVGETAVVEVAGAFSDPDDTLTYAASSSDAAVATASVSGSRVTLTPVAAGRATITVTATAGGGTGTSVTQRFEVRVWTGTSIDYDEDDDGLIEIMTLAQLDAVRYDLDGNGVPDSGAAVYAAAFPHAGTGMGCLTGGGCTGYQLGTDLDFDTNGNGKADGDDAYWSYGAGWDPLGEDDAGFSAIFEGNEHIVRHLHSERAAAGMFRKISAGAVIRRVGLIDVDLTCVWNREEATVGGLVASQAGGVIHASYVTGHVTGTERVGGLVGESSAGAITASYAAARVTGNTYVGGLVGINGGEVRLRPAMRRAAWPGTAGCCTISWADWSGRISAGSAPAMRRATWKGWIGTTMSVVWPGSTAARLRPAMLQAT